MADSEKLAEIMGRRFVEYKLQDRRLSPKDTIPMWRLADYLAVPLITAWENGTTFTSCESKREALGSSYRS